MFVGHVVMRTAAETISFEDVEMRMYKVEEGKPIDRNTAYAPEPYTVQLLNLANMPLGTFTAG
jgi:hypothetical protein